MTFFRRKQPVEGSVTGYRWAAGGCATLPGNHGATVDIVCYRWQLCTQFTW
jgi:hypothetical protein